MNQLDFIIDMLFFLSNFTFLTVFAFIISIDGKFKTGISIKPSDAMCKMKTDMGGAAGMFCAFVHLLQIKII